MPTAFLSKPAARPSGCANRSPIAVTGDPRTAAAAAVVTGAAARIAAERRVVRALRIGPGQHVVEEQAVGPAHQRAVLPRFQSCRLRTPMSPAVSASMPCTAAPRPCTVVMHGMSAPTAAVRIS